MTTTTASWIFEKAINLMDEQNEVNGEVRTQDTKEYEFRTLDILNVLRGEVFRFSDTFETLPNGERAVCPEILKMDQILYIDDVVAQTILPYGLAAHLLLGENDTMASFFNQRYMELLMSLGKDRPAVWEEIPDPFG